TLYLSAPVGGFKIHHPERPQLFLVSGVGITPLISMYRQVAGDAVSAEMIHVATTETAEAFVPELEHITASGKNNHLHIHLRDREGYLEADELKTYISDKT
ncbi:nitric oxide dioxygenase, partial [Staphylococcus pseudintermedius]